MFRAHSVLVIILHRLLLSSLLCQLKSTGVPICQGLASCWVTRWFVTSASCSRRRNLKSNVCMFKYYAFAVYDLASSVGCYNPKTRTCVQTLLRIKFPQPSCSATTFQRLWSRLQINCFRFAYIIMSHKPTIRTSALH